MSLTSYFLSGGVGAVTSDDVEVSVLRREPDGTVTIVSLAASWRANLTREPNGSVTISG